MQIGDIEYGDTIDDLEWPLTTPNYSTCFNLWRGIFHKQIVRLHQNLHRYGRHISKFLLGTNSQTPYCDCDQSDRTARPLFWYWSQSWRTGSLHGALSSDEMKSCHVCTVACDLQTASHDISLVSLLSWHCHLTYQLGPPVSYTSVDLAVIRPR